MENDSRPCRCIGCKRDPEVLCKGKKHHYDEHDHRHQPFSDSDSLAELMNAETSLQKPADEAELLLV